MKTLVLPNGREIAFLDKLTALYCYNEIFVEKQYLRYGITIDDGNTILDVGANIGLFTLFASSIAKNLIIHAFEPVSPIFEVLKKNVLNISGDVTIHNIGLGAEEATIDFQYYPRVSADSAAVPFDWDYKVNKYVENYEQAVCKSMPIAKIIPKFLRRRVVKAGLKRIYKGIPLACTIRPLSAVIKEQNIERIDLLKIDAENYEKHVLAGLQDEDWNKILKVTMEVHEHISGGETLYDDIQRLLESKGFTVILGSEGIDSFMGVNMMYAIKP